jgi:hypothetical protein
MLLALLQAMFSQVKGRMPWINGRIPRIVECVIFSPWEVPARRAAMALLITLAFYLLHQLPLILHGYPPMAG